jgi:glycosyltransferase involved in cell wall biosynthesis
MNILYLNTQPIFPILQGNQRTALNRILDLSIRHKVTFVSFFENEKERVLTEKGLNDYCDEIILIKKSKVLSIVSMISNLFFSNLPFQVAYYHSKEMKNEMVKLSKNKYEIIHINTIRMVQYADISQSPTLIDLHDSMILNITRRLNSESFFKKIFYKYELKRIKKYELDIIQKYKSIMVLANQDKETLGNPVNVDVIHLGVDTNSFKRVSTFNKKEVIIITGNMNYTPNVEAVEWFIDNCWLKLKEKIPNLLFRIVGANPNERINKYLNYEGITITGQVESIKDEIESAYISIAPMQSGSGMQNKILEAMACEVPVICTTMGMGNIKAEHGKNILVADDPSSFSNLCLNLFEDFDLAKKIGRHGYEFVKGNYSISKHCEELEILYEKTILNYANLSK